MDNLAIDTALELGLEQCLRQLQKSNPSLLLSADELQIAERSARYIPLIASAMATLVSEPRREDLLNIIQRWKISDAAPPGSTQSTPSSHNGISNNVDSLRHSEVVALIESRLRAVIADEEKPPPKDRTNAKDGDESSEDNATQSNSSDRSFDNLAFFDHKPSGVSSTDQDEDKGADGERMSDFEDWL